MAQEGCWWSGIVLNDDGFTGRASCQFCGIPLVDGNFQVAGRVDKGNEFSWGLSAVGAWNSIDCVAWNCDACKVCRLEPAEMSGGDIGSNVAEMVDMKHLADNMMVVDYRLRNVK